MAQLLLPQADSAGGLLLPKYGELTNQASAPSAPATGKTRLYIDSNGLLQLLSPTAAANRRICAHWGSGTAFPAGAAPGDTFVRTDVGTSGALYQYVGSGLGSGGWIVEGSVVCTATTRPATALYASLPIFETDTSRNYQWTGTAWAWLNGGTNPADIGQTDMSPGLAAGFTAGTDGCHYRVKNGYLDFQCHLVTTANTTTGVFFTFPAALKPGFNHWWLAEAVGVSQGEVKADAAGGTLGLFSRPNTNTVAVTSGGWLV